MLPNWKQAPAWAHYVAMDNTGDWGWHEHEPHAGKHEWESKGRIERVRQSAWNTSLVKRP